MQLTTKGRYAVMAMADLALQGGEKTSVALSAIAARQDISLSYLEQLFARLRQAGLVSATRGPGGGYRLSRSARDIPVADIILAANESIKATRCETGSALSCTGVAGRCLAHDLWDELGRQIQVFLSSISLADVIERRVLGRACPPVEAT